MYSLHIYKRKNYKLTENPLTALRGSEGKSD